MKLNLKNPLVFFDLETTGTNINTDRIVEICYLKRKCTFRKPLPPFMAFMTKT